MVFNSRRHKRFYTKEKLKMRPLRFITFMHDFPEIEDIVGGTQVIPYELLTNLAKKHYECIVYTTGANSTASARTELNGYLTIKPLQSLNIRYMRALTRPFFILLTLIRIARKHRHTNLYLYRQIPSPIMWLFWLPIPQYQMGLFMFIVARLLGIRTCGGLEDVPPEQEEYIISQMQSGVDSDHRVSRKLSVSGRLRSLELWLLFRFSNFTVIASEGMRELVIDRHRVRPQRIATFRASCNPDLVSGLQPHMVLPAPPWTITYTGSLADASIGMLIDSCRIVRKHGFPVQLVLAGRDNAGCLDSLLSGQDDWIHHLADTKYSSFGTVAANTDILVVSCAPNSAHMEMVWPLKIPLYLGAGRPVILTRTREVDTFISWRDICYVCQPNAESIAGTITEIINSPERAYKKAERAREFILQHLTWDQTVDALVKKLAGP